jgi:competence protein ComEA
MNWFWDNIHLKKEDRSGMILFVCILFFLLIVKWYLVVLYKPYTTGYSAEIISNLKYTIIQDEEDEFKPTTKSSNNSQRWKVENKKKQRPKIFEKKIKDKKVLFLFDPNSTSVDSLNLLGFSKYTSNNIDKYRSKGGRFKQAKDLKKIYGLDSVQFAEVYPFIRIKAEKVLPKLKNGSYLFDRPTYPIIELSSIDINLADTTEFKKLIGIGSVYAKRIVKFRTSLGGYFTIDQIKDVWGVSDSLFIAIEPYLTLDASRIKKKNINALDKEILVKHPYINWKKAKAILKYKKMHGNYKSMNDFEKLHGLDRAFVDTLRQYFVAQ